MKTFLCPSVSERRPVTLLLILLIQAIFHGSSGYAFTQQETLPPGWNYGGMPTDYKTDIDSKVFQHGQKSASVESVADKPADFCTLMQSMVKKEYNGKRVRMSGYIKTSGEDVTATMWARVDDLGKKVFGDFDNMMDRPLRGTHDWTKCEIVFDASEKSAIFFGILFKGNGKAWCDNFTFEVVPSTVNKTAKPIGSPLSPEYLEQLKQYPDPIPDKPPFNLDFEQNLSTSVRITSPANPVETNLPNADLHVHLTQNFASSVWQRYEKAAAMSGKMGVTFGIAEEYSNPDPKVNDSFLSGCISMARKYGLYIGLQVLQPGWQKLYSKKIIDSVDYVIMDALMFTDKDGKIKAIWAQPPILTDVDDFMARYVAYNIKVISDQIDIWVNPTFLPPSLQGRYDELWTETRMKAVIDAAVKNNVAIEINSRYKIPGKKFILAAKAAGAHFTFGSNEHDTNIGNIEWSVNMAKECGLEAKDFFTPPRKLR